MGDLDQRADVTRPAALTRDLKPRAVSAAVLAVVALGGNWAGHLPFAVLVLSIALVMAWEWSRIVRGADLDAALAVHGGVVVAAVGLTVWGAPRLAVVVVLAGSIAVAALVPRMHMRMSALGVAYVCLPAIAMVWLRGSDAVGAAAILFVFVIVWTTDTFAYICGRLIGGPKLWPALSPGKTWAGTCGGIAFAALAAVVFGGLLPRSAPVALALVAVGLSIVAQIGDLAESALKRAFAVKNASDLIPGHGGFLDRMDGVVAAASVAALLAVVRGAPSPAHGLLFWS